MSVTDIVIWSLVAVAVAEAGGLVALWVLWTRSKAEVETLRQRTDSRELLISGSRGAVKTMWQTANLVLEKGFGAAVRSSIDDLADWAEVERPDLAKLAPFGHVVILFSDIEGSTALNEEIGDRAWVRLIARHDKMVRELVSQCGGYVVKSQGDGFMIAFAEADQAVRCALAMQKALSAQGRRPGKKTLRVRIGVHMGKSVRRGDDLFGRNVAMAARVAAQADGGEILVSEPVKDATKKSLADEVTFREPREVELKGFRGVHGLYPVEPAA